MSMVLTRNINSLFTWYLRNKMIGDSKYRQLVSFFVCFCFSVAVGLAQNKIAKEDWLDWSANQLPPVPVKKGLSGAFAGLHKEVIIVAGGSNFDRPGWEGGQKIFHDSIYICQIAEGHPPRWEAAGRLPYKVAHGATVSTKRGILCLGGTDGTVFYDQVLLLSWDEKKQTVNIRQDFPSLPIPSAYMAATLADEVVYVAGGKKISGEKYEELNTFWSLDLSTFPSNRMAGEWRALPSWPGPARFGSVLVGQNAGEQQCIFLFSGKKEDKYLKDGYRYNPATGQWNSLSAMPRASLLAPAIAFGMSHILIFSGSDGHDLNQWKALKHDYHFSRDVWAYHTITGQWVKVGEMPFGIVGSTVIPKNNRLIMPGGEIRPTVRTNQVTMATLKINENRGFGMLDYLIFGVYLLMLAWIGFYFSKHGNSTNDFFLGGQRIPFWAAGISIMATQISSVGFMAIPAKVYATNWTYFAGVVTWFVVVPVVIAAFIPFFRQLKVTSAYEYLEKRFNAATRLFVAGLFCLFQIVGRTGIILYLPALALSAVTGIDTLHSILIMGVLSSIYTVMGGMEAVIWTDVIQAFVLFGGALFCIAYVIMDSDVGMQAFVGLSVADNKFSMGNLGFDLTTLGVWVVIIGNIFNRLSALTSDQSIVQRYMTTRSKKDANKALWANVWASIPWAILVYALGTALYVFYKSHPEKLDPVMATDNILPFFIMQNLPSGVSGLVVAGIFAAAMSSLDSSLHSVSTVVMTDFYRKRSLKLSDRERLKHARWITAFFGLLATAMAVLLLFFNVQSIFDLIVKFAGLFGGAMAGLFVLGIFSKKASGVGAMAGAMLSGLILFWVQSYTPLHFMLYGAAGLISCVAGGYLFSLFMPNQKNIEGLTIYTRDKKDK